MEWSYSDDNTLKVCIHRATEAFVGQLYYGLADNGRDFRGGGQNDNNFGEIGFCSGLNVDGEDLVFECKINSDSVQMIELEEGCYGFEDSSVLDDGQYSAMYMTIAFSTEYE